MAKGKIVAYSPDVSAGVVKSKDRELCFFKSQWFSKEREPDSGLEVLFDESHDQAENVRPATSEKSGKINK